MIIVGIDPGADGGYAVMEERKLYKKPIVRFVRTLQKNIKGFGCDVDGLKALKENNNDDIYIYLEDVHAIKGAAAKPTFNFGRNVGKLGGIMEAAELDFNLVLPTTGKKEFGLIYKNKQASIDKAKELFPGVSLHRTERSTGDSDGMAEALLICEYGRRQHENNKHRKS